MGFENTKSVDFVGLVAVGVYLGTRLILSWLNHSSVVCNLLDRELAGVSPGHLWVGQ